MKFFLVLLFVGCVSASFREAFEKASDDAVRAFKRNLEEATPLHMALGVKSTEELLRFERGVKEELEKHIKDAFERTLKRVLDAISSGATVNPEAVKSLLELREKIKDLDIMDHELEGMKEQFDSHLKQILEKIGIYDASYSDVNPMHSMFEDLSFRNFIIRIKEMILEKMDVSNLKQGLSKALGQASQSLCEWLTNRGQEKVINFFDRFLDSDEGEVSKRALPQDFDVRLQEYFSDLQESMMHMQTRMQRLQSWLSESVSKSLSDAQTHINEVRKIATNAVRKSKDTTSTIDQVLQQGN